MTRTGIHLLVKVLTFKKDKIKEDFGFSFVPIGVFLWISN